MSKKRSRKVNGFLGSLRLIISTILLYFILALYIIIMSIISYFLFGSINLVFIFGFYFLLSVLLYFFEKFNDRFHVREIKRPEEIDHLIGKRLIHYTNYINDDTFDNYKKTGFIRLFGNDSARANYRMKFKEKNKKFIWFHVENNVQKREPDFNSFMQAHYSESKPRKYKVVIDFKDVLDKKMYINPSNGNIIIREASIYEKAEVYEEFNWYSNRLYLNWALKSSIGDFLYIIPFSYQQFLGIVIDKIKKVK